MGTLRHIESSPCGAQSLSADVARAFLERSNAARRRLPESHSAEMARVFLEARAQSHPADTIETPDLRDAALPAFSGQAASARDAALGSQDHTMLVFGESASPFRLACIALIAAGIVGLRVSHGS